MNVFFPVTWWVIVCITFHVESRTTRDSDIDHEDVGSVDSTNASLYTTSEMRDKVLAEWKGKTDEIQGYFDQLPSEEFKENSEDVKFKLYYERKGLKDIDTNQVFNITPVYREPPENAYTIEVNDSYVPKYRVTTSEEERMEKYGTFNSETESSEISSEEVKKKKKKKKKESSESGGGKAKKKKEKKTWPSNMDPKEKRKKKKPKTTEDDEKRKELVEKTLNGVKNVRLNIKKIKNTNKLTDTKKENTLQNKLQGNQMKSKYDERKFMLGRKINNKNKNSGLYPKSNNQNNEMKTMKSEVNKLIDNNEIENKLENIERQRKRSKQSINRHPLRPYL